MRRKSGVLAGCFILVAVSLSGCGVITLTDKESDLIAQYAAGALLNHTETYGDRLIVTPVSEAAVSAEPTVEPVVTEIPETTQEPVATETPNETSLPAETQAPADGTLPDATEEPTVSLNELYQVAGMDITYNRYEFCNEYPKKSDSYQISANKDEILLVVKFKVTNTTSKKKRINLINRQISYEMSADESRYKPTISVLENGGLNFLDTKIKPGASEEAVLIYAVPKKVRDAQSIGITVAEGDNKSKVILR